MKKIFKKIGKIFMRILIVMAFIAVISVIFLKFWPSFGALPSESDKQDYAKRSSNYDGKIFYNEHEYSASIITDSEEKNVYLSNKGVRPEGEIPIMSPDFSKTNETADVHITWLGHSSLLIQMHGMNILVDPVFSNISSPVSFVGVRRFTDIPVSIEDLPEIDICIYSHDHYDHLDYPTVKKLDEKVKRYIVPLGVENHLERWKVSPDKITNMAWWEEVNIEGLTIGCTPARHFSGRSLNDRFMTLWASWVFKDENNLIFESGDSGYDTQYEEVHDKYGDFDFVMVDCAQYDIRWPSTHQTPEEAFEAIKTLGTDKAMPVHWCAFVLAAHPWDDSVSRIVKACDEYNDSAEEKIQILTPELGQTFSISDPESYMDRWYEDIP